MQIESLHIDSFAGLCDFDLAFGAGLNIIEGKNESGKSTVAAFLRFLFYGVSAAERELFTPFGGATLGGFALLDTAAGKLRLSRRVNITESGARETVTLADAATGKPVCDAKEVGVYLFGVGAKTFADTAYFRQLGDTAPDCSELNDAIGNILFSGSENADAPRAIKKLDDFRRQLKPLRGTGGKIPALERSEEELAEKLRAAEDANRVVIASEEAVAAYREKIEIQRERKEKAERLAEAARTANQLRLRREKKRFEEQAEDAHQKLDALLPDGRDPSMTDILAARHLAAALPGHLEIRQERVSRREQIETEMAAVSDDTAVGAAVEAAGGAEPLLAHARTLRAQAKRRTVCGILLLLLGAGCAACGALSPTAAVPALAFYAAGSVLAVLGIVCLLLAGGSRRRLRAITAIFGRGCAWSHFVARIDSYEQNRNKLAALREELDRVAMACDDAERAVAADCGEAATRLYALGADAPSSEDAVAAALTEAADRAEMQLAAAGELRTVRQNAIERAAELSRSIGTESERELAARLETLAVPDAEQLSIPKTEADVRFYANALDRLTAELHTRELTLHDAQSRLDDPVALSAELEEVRRALAMSRRQFTACVRAIDAMEKAAQNLRGGVAPRLSEGVCRRLAAVTGGRYSDLHVDADLTTVYRLNGEPHTLDTLSAGTRDLAYISLRLALVDLLYTKERPPLLFDESLAHQDPERTANALALLAGEENTQSLLFTCRGVEAACAAPGSFTKVTMPPLAGDRA